MLWVGASGYILEMLMLERLMQELACGAVLQRHPLKSGGIFCSRDKRQKKRAHTGLFGSVNLSLLAEA